MAFACHYYIFPWHILWIYAYLDSHVCSFEGKAICWLRSWVRSRAHLYSERGISNKLLAPNSENKQSNAIAKRSNSWKKSRFNKMHVSFFNCQYRMSLPTLPPNNVTMQLFTSRILIYVLGLLTRTHVRMHVLGNPKLPDHINQLFTYTMGRWLFDFRRFQHGPVSEWAQGWDSQRKRRFSDVQGALYYGLHAIRGCWVVWRDACEGLFVVWSC